MENLGYKEGWSKPRRISRAVSVSLQNEISPLATKLQAPRSVFHLFRQLRR